MNSCRIFILVFAISLSLTTSLGAEEPAKYLFRIPSYPGTELFQSHSPGLSKLDPPNATILRIYKTKDGSPIDKDEVIGFYEEHFRKNGWKEAVSKRLGDEPYLGLQVHVFEHLPDGTHIQVAGKFCLWVAPKDGMFTMFMKQWRVSKPGQRSVNHVYRINETLERIAKELNYIYTKGATGGSWQEYYENEYLIDRVLVTLSRPKPRMYPKDKPPPRAHLITVSIFTYRDSEVAKEEEDRLKSKFHIGETKQAGKINDRKRIRIPFPYRAVIRIEKIIVNISGEPREVVDRIVAEIEKSVKQETVP